MENAKGKMPYVISLLEKTLSKERKSLDEWRSLATSSDLLVARQANGNITSNQERVRQLEDVMSYLCPPKPTEENSIKV